MTHPVTINSDQVSAAKILIKNLYGITISSIDISFPYQDRIDPAKGAILLLSAPGYENYRLVIPPGTNQTNFNVHFTPDPKEMAKLGSTMVDPTIRKGEAINMVSRDAPGQTALERTILRWYFDSDPRGARIFWRVISSVPDQVKNTNETYLMTTPFEETRSFNILGLTYENSRDVTIEIKLTKKGYYDQIKRFNVRQAIDQQEISGFFEMVPEEE